jgi:hypothetical protein
MEDRWSAVMATWLKLLRKTQKVEEKARLRRQSVKLGNGK